MTAPFLNKRKRNVQTVSAEGEVVGVAFIHRKKTSTSEILLTNLEVLHQLRAGLGYFY